MLLMLLATITVSMNWKERKVLNPNAQPFTPRFPFEKGTVYHLDNDADIGYLKRDADGEDYKFCISESSGKLLSVFCEVDCQIFYTSDCAKNIIRTKNYEFDDLMQAVKRNNINKLQKILTQLELDDLEYAIKCVMTQESQTGNTVLHVAKDENIYLIVFGVFWFSKDTNQLLKFVTQKNSLNETPLVNALEQKNEKMVNMLLSVLKEQSSHKLMPYIMERNDRYKNRPLEVAFSNHNNSMEELFLNICQNYGNHSTLIHYFMETTNDVETILHTAAHAKNPNYFSFIINVFLRTKERKKLMCLLIKQDITKKTALHNLIERNHFCLLHVILQQLKTLADQKTLLKLVLLTSDRYGTILHFVCKQKMCPKIRIGLLETMFNLFADKHALMEFVTQKDKKTLKLQLQI